MSQPTQVLVVLFLAACGVPVPSAPSADTDPAATASKDTDTPDSPAAEDTDTDGLEPVDTDGPGPSDTACPLPDTSDTGVDGERDLACAPCVLAGTCPPSFAAVPTPEVGLCDLTWSTPVGYASCFVLGWLVPPRPYKVLSSSTHGSPDAIRDGYAHGWLAYYEAPPPGDVWELVAVLDHDACPHCAPPGQGDLDDRWFGRRILGCGFDDPCLVGVDCTDPTWPDDTDQPCDPWTDTGDSDLPHTGPRFDTGDTDTDRP